MTTSNGTPVSVGTFAPTTLTLKVFLLVYKTITTKSPAPVHELGKMTMNAVRRAFFEKKNGKTSSYLLSSTVSESKEMKGGEQPWLNGTDLRVKLQGPGESWGPG